jgi:hypothetical protein
MSLISYVKTAMNKRLLISESRTIRIDVHPVEENPTNIPHGFHTQSAYDAQPYVSHVVHI